MRQECHPGWNKISSCTSKLIVKGMETVFLVDYKCEALIER
jgi:phosphoribosylaminoimidazole (AIR) synthetase